MPQNITLFRIEPGLNVKNKALIPSAEKNSFIKASQMKRIKIVLTFQINFLQIACPLT
jgi:hypothetical protein